MHLCSDMPSIFWEIWSLKSNMNPLGIPNPFKAWKPFLQTKIYPESQSTKQIKEVALIEGAGVELPVTHTHYRYPHNTPHTITPHTTLSHTYEHLLTHYIYHTHRYHRRMSHTHTLNHMHILQTIHPHAYYAGYMCATHRHMHTIHWYTHTHTHSSLGLQGFVEHSLRSQCSQCNHYI